MADKTKDGKRSAGQAQETGLEGGPLRVRDAGIRAELEGTLEERRVFIRSFDWGASTEWELRREDFVAGLQAYESRFRELVLRDRRKQDQGQEKKQRSPGEQGDQRAEE